MEKLRYFAAITGHIFRSAAGLYLYPFNREWDECLQRILDEGEIVAVNEYIATFSLNENLFAVWIANRWFAYGELNHVNAWRQTPFNKFRPRFRTMYRLHLMVRAWLALEHGND
ncbi:hypothetical protein ACQYRI_12000 [Salmonella enterica]